MKRREYTEEELAGKIQKHLGSNCGEMGSMFYREYFKPKVGWLAKITKNSPDVSLY